MRLLAAAVLSASTACFVDPGLSGDATDAGASTTETTGVTGPTTTGAVTTTGVVSAVTGEPMPGCSYASDFSSEPAEWSELTPAWTWDPGGALFGGEFMTSDVASRTVALYSGAVPADVALTARVRLKAGGRAGLLLKASPKLEGDYLAIELDGSEGRVAVYVTENRQVALGMDIASETWMTLRGELAGGALTIALNGSTPVSGLQFTGNFGDGVGLFVASGAAEFDDVTICAPGG